MGGGVVAVLLQHVQQVKMSTKHYFLRKQCVCWTNLQVTFEFLIVNHDVFSLLALELGLLQTVLQRPQFLQSHTTLFILSSTALTKKRKRSHPRFYTSLHERKWELPWRLPLFFEYRHQETALHRWPLVSFSGIPAAALQGGAVGSGCCVLGHWGALSWTAPSGPALSGRPEKKGNDREK